MDRRRRLDSMKPMEHSGEPKKPKLKRYFDDEDELMMFAQQNSHEPRLTRLSNLIKMRKQLLASKVIDLPKCEQIISQTIYIMHQLNEETKGEPYYSLDPQLAEAYYRRALCRQEADPESNSKCIMLDAYCALKFWSTMPTLPKKHLDKLYRIYDFLSLKGNTEHHVMIYQIMIKSLNSKSNGDLKDWFLKLWHSRRLSHTLCGSPVCEVFLTTLPNYCDDWETWKSSMDDIDGVGFQHKLALSSHVTYHLINRVAQAATNLVKKDPLSTHSQLVASHLYYDLAETLIAKGSMIEALFYARKAYGLRSKLFDTMCCMKPGEKTVDGNRDVGSIYSYETFTIDQHVATTPWSNDEVLGETTSFIVNPWNTLKCFLESILQCGNLEEDVMHAENLLLDGKNLSSSCGSSVFSIQFSQALGRFYLKQQKWELAEEEIKNAQKIWDVNNCQISCLKCKTVLEVFINQQYGDLHLERDRIKGIRKAISYYIYGMEKLKRSMWKNIFSSPGKVRTMFCSKSRISLGLVAENDGNSCWHCQESRIMRSMSLQSVDNLKVEYIRRSIMIRLLGRIGKCHRLQGDQSAEKKALFERLSLFVIRSTYNPDLSVSDNFISKIIDKRLTGFAYTTDYATTIYELCSFFLRNPSKKSRISMDMLVCGLKISYMLSREVPTLHQEVSRLLGILYASGKVRTKHGVAPSVEQWASFFHQSSIGAYFNNRLTARMRKIEGQKLMEDNTEGNLEKCVLQFFNHLPDFPIICFSIYGEDSHLPSNILPFSDTSVWIQVSRLGSDKVAIIVDIVPIESSLKDTVYSDLRLQYPSTERRNLTVFDKVASVFNSVHEAKDMLVMNQQQPEPQRMEFDTWFKKLSKLDRSLSVILSDLETKWFLRLKKVLLGDPLELPHDVLKRQTPESLRSPVVLVMDPEMQRVPWECMPFLRSQDTYRMPSVMSILSTLKRSCSTGAFPTVDPRQVYYVMNPENDLQYHEDILSPVFKTNNFLGLAGEFPSSDLLKKLFRRHGIFLYFGHGEELSSMMEVISKELETSSSMILMACSSGAITLNGSCDPSGLIMDYILSGSPVIASHLWPIRAVDSVAMIKSMVNYWTQNRGYMTMASSVRIARQSSELPYIEGAGFVCYGVPTVIKRLKKFSANNS